MSLAGALGLFAMGAGIGHIGPDTHLVDDRAAGFNRRFSRILNPSPFAVLDAACVAHAGVLLAEFRLASFWCSVRPVCVGGLRCLALACGWRQHGRCSLASNRCSPAARTVVKELAVHLQTVVNQSTLCFTCCDEPFPVWGMRSIDCSECGTVLSRTARPDLGRTRSKPRLDGWNVEGC